MRWQASLVAVLPLLSIASSSPNFGGFTLSTRCPRCSRHLPLNPIAAAHPVTLLEERSPQSLPTLTIVLPKTAAEILNNSQVGKPTSSPGRPIASPHSTNESHSEDDAQCFNLCFTETTFNQNESSGSITDLETNFLCFKECKNEKAVKRDSRSIARYQGAPDIEDMHCFVVCAGIQMNTVADLHASHTCYNECRAEKKASDDRIGPPNLYIVMCETPCKTIKSHYPGGAAQCVDICVRLSSGDCEEKCKDVESSGPGITEKKCTSVCKAIELEHHLDDRSTGATIASPRFNELNCADECEPLKGMFPRGLDQCKSGCVAFYSGDCDKACNIAEEAAPGSGKAWCTTQCKKGMNNHLEDVDYLTPLVYLTSNLVERRMLKVQRIDCDETCHRLEAYYSGGFDQCSSACEASKSHNCDKSCEIEDQAFPGISKWCLYGCNLQADNVTAAGIDSVVCAARCKMTEYANLGGLSKCLGDCSPPPKSDLQKTGRIASGTHSLKPLNATTLSSPEGHPRCWSVCAAEILMEADDDESHDFEDELDDLVECIAVCVSQPFSVHNSTRITGSPKTRNSTVDLRAPSRSASAPTRANSTRYRDDKPDLFYLKTRVIKGSNSKNNLYVEAFHTMAGRSDAVLEPKPNQPKFFLNGTYVQYYPRPENPIVFTISFNEYPFSSGWAPVRIAAPGHETRGFYWDKNKAKGLQWKWGENSETDDFTGWLACDWEHGMPQLFWKMNDPRYHYPDTCSEVVLERED